MAEAAKVRPDLVVLGSPPEHRATLSDRAQWAALARHWRLHGSRVDAPCATPRQSLLERSYRALDRRLFGRGRWAPTAAGPSDTGLGKPDLEWQLTWQRTADVSRPGVCLHVEYDGLPMHGLEQAVRQRLGQPGGMVQARVWLLQAGHGQQLLMSGRLRLDHRSLHRSVVLCAAKLPTLLHGAWARYSLGRVEREAVGHDISAPALRSAASQLWRLLGTSLSWLVWREQWVVEMGRCVSTPPQPGTDQSLLRPSDASWWADPFLLNHEDRRWLLVEVLPPGSSKGRIGAMEIDAQGRPLGAMQTVLDEPWHLSYPFVWQDGDRRFLIPEAGHSGKLTLYEAASGAGSLSWRACATLLEGLRLADATVVAHQGRLWMFATGGDEGAVMDDALYIFWADRIEGPWHPHTLNPVKIDGAHSRPAGTMWVADGCIHRVAQDCSSTYGERIHCMRVTRLSETEFEEQPLPGWGRAKATQREPWHTFNTLDSLTVVDRLVRRPRWQRRSQSSA